MENFSIVIPVYNESQMLARQISRLFQAISRQKFPVSYEIILVENGSTDNTYRIAQRLCRRYPNLKVIQIDHPSYGQAFKAGIRQARYPYIYQFDLDFWDTDFLCMAQSVFSRYDIVIGSKNLAYSHDNRPWSRRVMSAIIERIIQWRFAITLTDTHGLKAMRKDRVAPLLSEVVCTNHFFDSELLIRLAKKGYPIKELPVDLTEIRSTRFPFLLRLREVASEFITLLRLPLHTTHLTTSVARMHQRIALSRSLPA